MLFELAVFCGIAHELSCTVLGIHKTLTGRAVVDLISNQKDLELVSQKVKFS